MKIIACDYHPSFQQIALWDESTGELSGRRLAHPAEAEAFYRSLQGPVRVGMEAIGNALWFERLLAELGHELWIGDAARIRAAAVRPQKTDARDAAHLLQLMLEERFPRIWVPSPADRDLRQLLLHRHKLVQMRTQVKNQLQHLALNQACGDGIDSGAGLDASFWKAWRCRLGRLAGGRICWTSGASWSVRWRSWTVRSKPRPGRDRKPGC